MEGHLKAPIDRALPCVVVVHRGVALQDARKDEREVVRTRKVKFVNFVQPAYFHSIEIEDSFERREKGSAKVMIKSWTERKTVKAYTFAEAGVEGPGEAFWTTWRHQLEVFVDAVRGREVARWVGPEDSIRTIRMIDMAYAASGLPARPASQFKIA
jgi:hypothetical protein